MEKSLIVISVTVTWEPQVVELVVASKAMSMEIQTSKTRCLWNNASCTFAKINDIAFFVETNKVICSDAFLALCSILKFSTQFSW